MSSVGVACPRSLLAALCALLGATPALGHAGLPESSSIELRPGVAGSLFVGTTFGALTTSDDGQRWTWICPEAMAYGGWRPQRFHWLTSGDLVAPTGDGLLVSSDSGCSWRMHPFFVTRAANSLAVHPSRPRVLYVTGGRSEADSGLWRSDDAGATFTPTGLVSTGVVLTQVLLAGERGVYVTGYRPASREGLVFYSDDEGATFELRVPKVEGLDSSYALTGLAVSPVAPNRLFARITHQLDSVAVRSDDGGKTFTPVFTAEDYVQELEVSADGSTVWLATYNRIYRATDGGKSFAMLESPEGNACVRRDGAALYGCGSAWVNHWSVARTKGEGWEVLLTLDRIDGASGCPAGTPVRELCGPLWPQMAAALGTPWPRVVDGGAPQDAGAPEEDAGTQPRPPPELAPPALPRGCSCAASAGAPALFFAALLLTRAAGRSRSRRRP